MGRTRKQVGTSLCYDTHLGAQSTSHEEIRGPLWCAANARAQCQQSFFCPWIGCSPFTTLRQWYSQLQYTHTQSITEYFVRIWIDLDWFGLPAGVMSGVFGPVAQCLCRLRLPFWPFCFYHSRPCTCLESPATTVLSFNATYPCCRRSMFLIHVIYFHYFSMRHTYVSPWS